VGTEVSPIDGRHAIRTRETRRINNKNAVQAGGKRIKLGFLTALCKKPTQISIQERTMHFAARCSTLLLAGAAACAALHAPAGYAGPLDEARVKARVAATARGDIDAIMADYTDDAVFQWVGGGLDGEYRGRAAIRGVWDKFKANQGEMQLTLGRVDSNTNPKGVTVSAFANYKGKMEVKVRQIFVYRDSKLAMEIWQIDPGLAVTP
jgi:ketosteroid isomerase-like protein